MQHARSALTDGRFHLICRLTDNIVCGDSEQVYCVGQSWWQTVNDHITCTGRIYVEPVSCVSVGLRVCHIPFDAEGLAAVISPLQLHCAGGSWYYLQRRRRQRI